MKKILVLGIMILLAMNTFALRTSVLEYDPLPAKAGDFVDVFISIENNSKGDTGNLKAELIPKDSLRLAYGQEAVKNLGILPGFKSAVVKYRLEVTREAIDGDNIMEFVVRESGKPDQRFDLSIDVDNKLPNIEIGGIESDPRKILPDTDDVQLTVTLLNTGEDVAENLKATLVLPEDLEVADSFSNISLLGNLNGNSSAESVFFIDVPEETKSGTYTLKVLTQYTLNNSGANNFLEKELSFDLIVKPVPRFEVVEVTTNPADLQAGNRNVSLKIKIKNIGEANGESVRVKVFEKSEQPFEFDKAFDFVAPKLEPGQEGEATLLFRIKDDASIQNYLLELEIKSFVDDTVRTQQEVISVPVKTPINNTPDPFLLVGGAGIILIILAFVFRKKIASIAMQKKKNGK